MDSGSLVRCGFILALLLCHIISGEDYFPPAQGVSWSSLNFKTILVWDPEPRNHSYTVEFFGAGENRERSPQCIRSRRTECDLTHMLKDLKETYYAEVLSEPLLGMTSDLIEFPHSSSEKFTPYSDTLIGRPEFTIYVNEDKTKITLKIQDPLSPFYTNGKLLNMRDIFEDDLQYRVTYRKATSTGKKVEMTDTNEIVLQVDRGESYCFYVQAFLPSRSGEKQLGALSKIQCSPAGEKSLHEEYGFVVLLCAALVIVFASVVSAILLWLCCKRNCRTRNEEKEKPYDCV